MKKILLFIILNILLFNFSYADDADSKQKELETKIKLLEKELEIEKLKKELAEQKKANEKTKNKVNSKDVNQGELNKNNQENKETIKINDEIDLNKEILKEIKSLGKFQEPKRYPEEFKIDYSFHYTINPFDTLVFGKTLQDYAQDFINTAPNRDLLFKSGKLYKNTIFLCSAAEVLQFSKILFDSN